MFFYALKQTNCGNTGLIRSISLCRCVVVVIIDILPRHKIGKISRLCFQMDMQICKLGQMS